MKEITGAQAADAIQRLASMQTARAQESRGQSSSKYLGEFAQRHKIEVRPGTLAALGRIVRNLDADGVRHIRSLSNELLEINEGELIEELVAIKTQLAPKDATTHQVKTRSAFITTVLRPFDSKYTSRWLSDRPELDDQHIQSVIEKLNAEKIANAQSLDVWAKKVLGLFEEIVVFRGKDASTFYSRPAGTVSSKSSRTYSQSWLAFTVRFRDQIWTLATGGKLEDDFEFETSKALRTDNKNSLTHETKSLANINNFSVAMSKTDKASSDSQKAIQNTQTTLSSSKKQDLEWIQVFIESRIDATAQATRRWENQNNFKVSLQKWLDTFPVIWGSAADEFMAKVSVKTTNGESDLTLPALTVAAGAERLLKAVEMQSE